MPLRMRVYEREPIGMALRRFKKLLERSGLQKELRARKEKVPGLKVTLVFYKDSPDKDLNEVPQLETWLRDEKMWDQYDPTDKDSPEVKRSGS